MKKNKCYIIFIFLINNNFSSIFDESDKKMHSLAYKAVGSVLLIGLAPFVQTLISEIFERKALFDKFKKKLYEKNINLSNIIIENDLKKELENIIFNFKNKDNIQKPKGIIFYGPPGTGKTFLSKAIAGTSKLPIYIIVGNDLISNNAKYTSNDFIKNLYENARKNSPCIIFIDEAEILIKKREEKSKENDNLLQTLLTEIDGFNSKNNIFTILSTNINKDLIDPAIYRTGRLNKIFYIAAPSKKTIKSIIENNLKKLNIHLDDEISIDYLSNKLENRTPSDINELFNKIILDKKFQNQDNNKDNNEKIIINKKSFDDSFKYTFYGLIDDDNNNKYLEIKNAYNLVSKALIAISNENYPYLIDSISIFSRKNNSGNFIEYSKLEKKFFSYKEYLAIIDTKIAGMLSEKFFFDNDSLSSENNKNDLNDIKKILFKAYKELGMGKKLFYKNDDEINNEIDFIIKNRIHYVKKIIDLNKNQIEKISEKLINQKTLFLSDINFEKIQISFYDKKYLNNLEKELENSILFNL